MTESFCKINRNEMLQRIKDHLEVTTGDLKVGVSVFQEADQFVFILFCNGLISHYLSLEFKGSVCYISKLDSTGAVKGIAKDFVQAALTLVDKKIICCFSQPKPSYVFTNASRNILNSFDLASFWIDVFNLDKIRIKVWCNQFNKLKAKYTKLINGHPFATIDEVECFRDDPKTRIKENLGDIGLDSLFTTMLCRKDFIKGCLIYSIDEERANVCDFNVDDAFSCESVTDYLRGMDFSTKESIINNTESFLLHFKPEIVEFNYKKRDKRETLKEKTITLKGKRRKTKI